MALYLKAKKLDIEVGDGLTVMLNNAQAEEEGIKEGQKVMLGYMDLILYVDVIQTETEVMPGQVGLLAEVWRHYGIPNDDVVCIDMFNRPDSIDYIKKKLLGHKLVRDEIFAITKDISNRKIRDIEVAYYMACFFSPGFDDDEVVNIAEGMARAGDILDFHKGHDEGTLVVDKHSIGGIAGKGVTPILVPIIASAGLLIPNSSTRAITSPAGTSDILEVVMPISFPSKQVMKVVADTNACMIWGGSLRLAPADDVMISVERSLHAQSFNKLIASIVAKKIAMGVDKVLIDIPYGRGAKMESPEDADMLGNKFIKIFEKVGIECVPAKRFVKGPDGMGIGPVLEMREVLRILEQHESRSLELEGIALDMAGKLLEVSGKSASGAGKTMAESLLKSGKALDKFWEIAMAQGATRRVSGESLHGGKYTWIVKSHKSGIINFINNKEVIRVARSLGTPSIKDAGMYFSKKVGDVIKEGEEFLTFYAASGERLRAGVEEFKIEEMLEIV